MKFVQLEKIDNKTIIWSVEIIYIYEVVNIRLIDIYNISRLNTSKWLVVLKKQLGIHSFTQQISQPQKYFRVSLCFVILYSLRRRNCHLMNLFDHKVPSEIVKTLKT